MNSYIYKLSDWIMRLAFLNILWIFFTLIGLVIIGFFPATIAMFTIVRHWIRGDTDIPILKTFWNTYKKNFLKANTLGVITTIVGYVIYLDLLFFRDMGGPFGGVMLFLSITILILYLMISFFLLPVFAHYDVKTVEYFKYAFIIGASYPFYSFYIGLSIFVIYYVTASFPVIFLFFSGSILSLLMMRFGYTAFEKIEKRNNSKHMKESVGT